MTHLIIQELERENLKTDLPVIKPGYTVRVHQKIKEGEKERIQIFEGLVIAINAGHTHNKTMTVRKVIKGIGVEKIFPLHSVNIAKIEVVRIGKVRRAKLYYMRNVSGKAARLKEIMVSKSRKKVVEEPVETKTEIKEEVLETTVSNDENLSTENTQDLAPNVEQGTVEEHVKENNEETETSNNEEKN